LVCLPTLLLLTTAQGLAQEATAAEVSAPEAVTAAATAGADGDVSAESGVAEQAEPPLQGAEAPAAQAAPEQAATAGDAPATGLVFSVRMPVGETFVRSFLGPQRAMNQTQDARLGGPRGVYDVPFINPTFYVFNGVRTPDFTVGMGFGFYSYDWAVTTQCTDPDTGDKFECQGIPKKTADGHIFQFAPAIMMPFFKSTDLTTEVYGTAAFILTWGPDISPQYDPIDIGGGDYVEPDIQATVFGLGGSLGVGGQHFLHPNFALGAETGIFYQQVSVDPEVTIDGNSLAAPEQEGWFLGGYAALTVSFVIGA